MKTVLCAILKKIPWKTLLALVAEMQLGSKLWDLVRRSVADIEADYPAASGEAKFKGAWNKITGYADAQRLSWTKATVRWGIEMAVRILKGEQTTPPAPPSPTPGFNAV